MKMRTFGSGDDIMIEYECNGKRATESALAVAFRTFQFFDIRIGTHSVSSGSAQGAKNVTWE
jgi:hypothetical protein